MTQAQGYQSGSVVFASPTLWAKARLEPVARADGRDTLVVIRCGDRKTTLRFLPRGE